MTSATTPKTILLAGNPVKREGVAGGAITPGMLLERGAADALVAHAAAEDVAQPAFALEYDLTGRGIDDAYSSGDQVVYGVFNQGEFVYAWLAANQNVADGVALTSNGDGRLKEAGTGDYVVAEAREAKVTTGDPERIRVEVKLGKLAA